MRTFEENIEGAIQLLQEVEKIRQAEAQAADDAADDKNLISWQGA